MVLLTDGFSDEQQLDEGVVHVMGFFHVPEDADYRLNVF
jgi:hypothetical protein